MKFTIDPGHGGKDPGTVGKVPFQLKEKEVNLGVSLLLESELVKMGHNVTMTRREDVYLKLEARAEAANQANADVFISVHSNSDKNTSAEGMEVYHMPGSTEGKRIAGKVMKSMADAFPDHRNRGVKEKSYAVLRLTRMPAILVECEFLSNPNQLVFLSKKETQQELAVAIAKAFE